ncbi:unnamed protein product, partial [Amoebophrya sp. A120]
LSLVDSITNLLYMTEKACHARLVRGNTREKSKYFMVVWHDRRNSDACSCASQIYTNTVFFLHNNIQSSLQNKHQSVDLRRAIQWRNMKL